MVAMRMTTKPTTDDPPPRERHAGQHDQCRLCRLARVAADYMKGEDLDRYIEYLSGLAPDPRD